MDTPDTREGVVGETDGTFIQQLHEITRLQAQLDHDVHALLQQMDALAHRVAPVPVPVPVPGAERFSAWFPFAMGIGIIIGIITTYGVSHMPP